VISGSSNEGIDWIGKKFNMIIVAGFPHPNYNEEQQAYDEYLDWKHKRKGFGYENATTIAMIKADQAIGRGIRKASDYCACILIDPRFIRHRDLLPVHLRKYAREVQASELGGKIRNFLENAEGAGAFTEEDRIEYEKKEDHLVRYGIDKEYPTIILERKEKDPHPIKLDKRRAQCIMANIDAIKAFAIGKKVRSRLAEYTGFFIQLHLNEEDTKPLKLQVSEARLIRDCRDEIKAFAEGKQ
jgi:hypothetical protein